MHNRAAQRLEFPEPSKKYDSDCLLFFLLDFLAEKGERFQIVYPSREGGKYVMFETVKKRTHCLPRVIEAAPLATTSSGTPFGESN
jgi:hypothetical protein